MNRLQESESYVSCCCLTNTFSKLVKPFVMATTVIMLLLVSMSLQSKIKLISVDPNQAVPEKEADSVIVKYKDDTPPPRLTQQEAKEDKKAVKQGKKSAKRLAREARKKARADKRQKKLDTKNARLKNSNRLKNKKIRARMEHRREMGNGANRFRLIDEETGQPFKRKKDKEKFNAILEELRNDPDVEYADPDIYLYKQAVPNDEAYINQWHYFDPVGGINLPQTWDITTGSQDIVVAVLDSGIVSHTDYNDKILPGYNAITEEYGVDCCYDAGSFHGSHVAGTVAALTNNTTGVSGVSWNSKILPVRVLGDDGGGSFSDILDGMLWAAGLGAVENPNPAKVINMSLGGQAGCFQSLQIIIDQLVANGVTVVVAAGNSNMDASQFVPASCNNIITVAATGKTGQKTYYSNFDTSPGNGVIDIAAPGGEQFYGGSPDGVLSTYSQDAYAYLQGTSMASPHVAGVVALMYAIDPNLTFQQIYSYMQDTARGDAFGVGIVDTYKLISKVQCLKNNNSWDDASGTCTEVVNCEAGTVLNPDTNTCVQCLQSSDCTVLQPKCSLNSCTSCSTNSDCDSYPDTSACDPATGACVQCVADIDCGDKEICQNNSCQAVECTQNSHCGSNQACSESNNCECASGFIDDGAGNCVQCASDANCGDKEICQNNNCLAVECKQDGHCSSNAICNPSNNCECASGFVDDGAGNCVQCVFDRDCGDKEICQNNSCQAVECTQDGHCSSNAICNDSNNCECAGGFLDDGAGNCVQCTSDANCGDKEICQNNSCQAVECKIDGHCGSNETCNVSNNCECASGFVDDGAGNCVQCAFDRDCGDKEVCQNNSCQIVECKQDGHCGSNETCNAGNNCECASGFVDDGAGNCVQCVFDRDCGDKEICQNNSCQAVECTQDGHCDSNETCSASNSCECASGFIDDGAGNCVQCTSDANCGDKEICQNNSCQSVECKVDGHCGSNEICNASNNCECASGFVDDGAGYCVQCAFDRDCGDKEVCRNNSCQAVECKQDSHCSSNETCNAGNNCECASGFVDDSAGTCVQCVFDRDCGDKEICQNSSCQAVECIDNSHCGSNAICNIDNNNCECASGFIDDGSGNCVECASDGNCGYKEICQNNSCQAVECKQDGHCGSNETCNASNNCECASGFVDNGSGYCVQCAFDRDCGDKEICQNNNCQAVECTQDSHCGSNKICNTSNSCECVNGFVNDGAGNCVQCASDANCGDKEICQNNSCQAVECKQDSHCGSNEICNLSNSCECVNGFMNDGVGNCVECVSNTNCGTGEICLNNSCIVGNCQANSDCNAAKPVCTNNSCEGCQSNNDCASYEGSSICGDAGRCVQCTSDTNCGDKEICQNNSCQAVECKIDGHCSTNAICNITSNSCECASNFVDDGSGNCVQCVSDMNCGDKEVCQNNSCRAVECKMNGHCDSNEICNSSNNCECASGFVDNGTGNCVQCASDANCGDKEICQNNSCQAVECKQDGHCGTNAICNESNSCECAGGFLDDGTGNCVQCTSDANCGDKEICQNNICQAVECKQDGHCNSNETCNSSNNCVCASGFVDDGAGNCVQCALNRDCADKEICQNNSCQAVECTQNGHCGSNEICNTNNSCECASGFVDDGSGTCVECVSDTSCGDKEICQNNSCQAVECKQDGHCGTNAICNESNSCECAGGFLDDGTGNCVQCTSDVNCGDKEICQNNSCQAVECTQDGHCDSNEICGSSNNCECASGFVDDGISNCVQCALNRDCDDKEICQNNSCLVVECTQNGHCSSNEICNTNNSCECASGFVDDGTGSCVQCVSDANCGDKEICQNNSCQAIECKQDNHCGSNAVCNASNSCECAGGFLDDGAGNCVQCTSDANCGDKEICQNNSCQAVECTQDGHCGSNEACNTSHSCECASGFVDDGIGNCVQCALDRDCGDKEICQNNSCQAVECKKDSHCGSNQACYASTNTCVEKVVKTPTLDERDNDERDDDERDDDDEYKKDKKDKKDNKGYERGRNNRGGSRGR